ncbi:MAG: hypothetical protein K5893_07150 [Prevotella sp.]|nr:hypothetical protein [Prevotella sp.]
MEIYLTRIAKRKKYNIERLSIIENGKFVSSYDTLEPTWRDYKGGEKKVKGSSAIPEGRIFLGENRMVGMVLCSTYWVNRLKEKIMSTKSVYFSKRKSCEKSDFDF